MSFDVWQVEYVAGMSKTPDAMLCAHIIEKLIKKTHCSATFEIVFNCKMPVNFAVLY